MSDEMDEIISEFVIEAAETLEKIDPMFVELEVKGYDKEILNEIFRGMHTLKGAAGFLGFQPIVDVAHRAESIMKRLRDAEIVLSRELMDVILKSVDALRLFIFHIRMKDGLEEDISKLLAELDSASEAAKPATRTEEEKVKMEAEPKRDVRADTGEDRREEVEVEVEVEAKTGPPPSSAVDQTQQMAKEREVVSQLRVDVSRIDKVMDFA